MKKLKILILTLCVSVSLSAQNFEIEVSNDSTFIVNPDGSKIHADEKAISAQIQNANQQKSKLLDRKQILLELLQIDNVLPEIDKKIDQYNRLNIAIRRKKQGIKNE